MLRVDGHKLQEIKDHYQEMAKREIARAVNDPDTDLKDDDIEAIKNKYKYQSNQKIAQLLEIGPKRLFNLGMAFEADGWRTGYTKAPIKNRVAPRRAKNKQARKTRREQRRK